MFENPAEIELTEAVIAERIRDLHYRNPFQILVFKKLDIGHNTDEIMKDRKIISDYIDNPENIEVRKLISQGPAGFEEASEILIEEIKRKGGLSKAA